MKDTLSYSMDVSSAYRVEGGRYLAELRKSAELTGDAVGEVLGVTRGQVSMWETGRSPLRPTLISKVAKLYGVEAAVLAKNTLKHSNPVIYALIFGDGGDKELKRVVKDIERVAEGSSRKGG